MDVLTEITTFLRERNAEAYFVGGYVRDEILGRTERRDIDLAVRGNAIPLARAFANAHGGAFYLMDQEHGVARALFGETYVDFAELRGELLQDLATRDFTVNAMAKPVASRPSPVARSVIDPFNGIEDLQARRVRAVSDGVFEKDAVRLVRALRLAAELDFTVEPHTEQLMRRDAPLLARAPMERVRDELFKLLAQPNAMSHLRRMDELGLMGALFPQVIALKGVTQSEPHVYDVFEHTLRTVAETERIQTGGYADVADGRFTAELQAHFAQPVSAGRTRGTLLRLVALLHDVGKAVTRSVDEEGAVHFYEHAARGAAMSEATLRALRLSNREIEIARRAIEHHLRPPQLARAPRVTNRAVYRYFRDTGDAGIDICVLALADTRAKTAPHIEPEKDAAVRATIAWLLDGYYRKPEVVVAPEALLDGNVLMRELGLKPGPQIGALLESIREAQADGKVRSREEALALARRIMDEGQTTKDEA